MHGKNTDLLNMVQTRRADDNCVAVLLLQFAVVRQPAKCNLAKGDVVLARDLLDGSERREVWFVPVPVTIVLTG